MDADDNILGINTGNVYQYLLIVVRAYTHLHNQPEKQHKVMGLKKVWDVLKNYNFVKKILISQKL